MGRSFFSGFFSLLLFFCFGGSRLFNGGGFRVFGERYCIFFFFELVVDFGKKRVLK